LRIGVACIAIGARGRGGCRARFEGGGKRMGDEEGRQRTRTRERRSRDAHAAVEDVDKLGVKVFVELTHSMNQERESWRSTVDHGRKPLFADPSPIFGQ
jgi:hypothetical protein